VRVETNRVQGFVNGHAVLEVQDDAWRGGSAGLAKFRDTQAEFKDFIIGTNVPAVAKAATSPAQLAALTSRLQQVEKESDARVMEGLKDDAVAGRSVLLSRADELERQARRMRSIASDLHTRAVESALLQSLEGPEERIDLFHCALLVSWLDNPALDRDAYRAELAQLTRELQTTAGASSSETGKVAALTQFLFTDQGFHGSRTDYYNRANSYINEVLDDREGLPITLSILFLELARQIGVTNVAGAPVPTHFMVRFTPAAGEERFIDVFNGGRILTRSDAVELVGDNVDRVGDADFRAATKREIVTRMLHNLSGVAERDGAGRDALRYLDLIVALNPDSAPDRLARARLRIQNGEAVGAKADLRWVLEKKPAGIDLDRLEDLFRSL
jgi:serine protease Do